MLDKLILGTANFGMEYGYRGNKVDFKDVQKIIDVSKKFNINFFDTAHGYGDSEDILLKTVGMEKMITKYIFDAENQGGLQDFCADRLMCYSILLHNPEILLSKKESERFIGIVKETNEKIKAGVSVYSKEEFTLAIKYGFDLVQCPYSVLDDRFDELISKNNIEVHVRSIFLQGMLITQDKDRIIRKCPSLLPFRQQLDEVAASCQMGNFEYCLKYALQNQNINGFVLGVSSENQLEHIVEIFKDDTKIELQGLPCDDLQIIDPRLWNA